MGRDSLPVRRALFSVHDKSGIDSLARVLLSKGADIFATDSTARHLAERGLPTSSVADLTGFSQLLGGRVKTLHPKVFAGVLSRGEGDAEELKKVGAPEFDLVAVNLYPFEQAARSRAGASLDELIELVDIGGSALLRASAKNHRRVAVISSPSQCEAVAKEIESDGGTSLATRERLALAAFAVSARYEATVHSTLSRHLAPDERFPELLAGPLERAFPLRYGENSHVRAAFYREPGWWEPCAANAERLSGKELSFNNLLDLDAALELVKEFDQSACAVIKHTNPCGVALAPAASDAFRAAFDCDPVSAYGGVVAFNGPVDAAAAKAMKPRVLDAVIAPGFDEEAAAILGEKKKGAFLVMRTGPWGERSPGVDARRIVGGMLLQERDTKPLADSGWKQVSKRAPTAAERRALLLAWRVTKHVKSNSVVMALDDRTVGVGAGQMSRVDAVWIASRKAGAKAKGSAMASDAYFPFRDGVDEAAKAGVAAIVHPGGSIRDDEVVKAADEHGMAMMVTGMRLFRH
jgi:phosphoribosylaminoimidazolecarboxamide formyltransferase/IMP cyclohydrolase